MKGFEIREIDESFEIREIGDRFRGQRDLSEIGQRDR